MSKIIDLSKLPIEKHIEVNGVNVPVRAIYLPRINFKKIKQESIPIQLEKLSEELLEVENGFLNGDKENLIEECFDVMQVAAGILDKIGLIDFNFENLKHIEKLYKRGVLVETMPKKNT